MKIDLATFFFALFLGLFVGASEKVLHQTRSIWKRSHRLVNPYLYMIWTELVVNLTFSIITFLYLGNEIPNSLGFLFGTVLLWSIQTQLLTQIIANRVALIMTSRRQARMLKWALAVPITIVNISVFCIWIPAHMDNATSAQINLNNIWERVEKAFFLIIDLGLNLIFLYLVRSRLISGGLTKYWRLYNFNAGIVVISTCMDVLLLGFLSLRNAYVYVQFAPVAYIIKLNIELTMAVLISKVVRSSCNNPPEDWYSSNHISDRYAHQATCTSNNDHRKFPPEVEMDTLHELDQESPKDLDHQRPGIMRTIVTTVQAGEDDASTEELVVNPKRMTR